MSNEWINNVGNILKSKAGNSYIKIEADEITLKKGDRLMLKSKAEEIEESVSSGKISEEKGEELKEKLHFIKYVIHKMPSN